MRIQLPLIRSHRPGPSRARPRTCELSAPRRHQPCWFVLPPKTLNATAITCIIVKHCLTLAYGAALATTAGTGHPANLPHHHTPGGRDLPTDVRNLITPS